MEIMNGGYAVEYVCRVVDQTGGQESVPESATMAQNTLLGKTSSAEGTKAVQDASKSKTDVYLNQALQIATPALNGLTDGMAGQVIGKGRQVINVDKAVSSGKGVAAVLGAAAPLITWMASEAVNSLLNERAKNDAIALSIDDTNLRRSMAGLDKINYTRTVITGEVRLEEDR